jgi:phosphomannomutase
VGIGPAFSVSGPRHCHVRIGVGFLELARRMKRLIVFDLDGTLALSKSALDDEMGALLERLLSVIQVAIISGGDFPQFQKQVIDRLPAGSDLANLSLQPTSGTKFFRYDGQWSKLYSDDLADEQKKKIEDALEGAVKQTGFQPEQTWGERIEDRGTQITYSALGQQAPLEAKDTWDPDFAKRKAIKAILDTTIPEFSVRLGGTTSIDVTRPGIDKAYGIRKLQDVLGIPISEMLFIGDAVFPGGNDYPAVEAGTDTIQVRDPNETKAVVTAIIACVS